MDKQFKPQFQLIDPMYTYGLACALTHGVFKHTVSYRDMDPSIFVGAVHRHLNAHQHGVVFDSDTGLFHLDHACADLMFLHWHLSKEHCQRWHRNITARKYIPKEVLDGSKKV